MKQLGLRDGLLAVDERTREAMACAKNEIIISDCDASTIGMSGSKLPDRRRERRTQAEAPPSLPVVKPAAINRRDGITVRRERKPRGHVMTRAAAGGSRR